MTAPNLTDAAEQRIAALQQKLAARTDMTGSAKPGFGKNVEAIRAEIERLQGGGSL